MIKAESYKMRLDSEEGLSFIEFNYMVLQAYDFLELMRRHDCRLQMGGSDQWGNIVAGVDLIRRLEQTDRLRHHLPADHDQQRREDGQDRQGRRVAGSGANLALRLLPVLDQHRRPRRGPLPGAVHLSADGGDPGGGAPARAARSTRPRRFWPSKRRSWRTGASRPSRPCRPRSGFSAAVNCPRRFCHRATSRGAAPRPIRRAVPILDASALDRPDRPGIPAFKLFHETGLAASGAAARRLIDQGGAYVNGERIDRLRAADHGPPT
ncbi:MAG: hypothetical protein MZV70_50370 [Desulfobacterales bacterium]|nr:hypothetical protein [Desulfobacterales bacterium]